ncbi:hypothetical protein ACFQU2_10910 [Siccirubricoccus deserti]
MDYLAAGLPVVANLGGRAARLLEDDPLGRCGIATPPGDTPALAGALAALAADPAAVRRWAPPPAPRQSSAGTAGYWPSDSAWSWSSPRAGPQAEPWPRRGPGAEPRAA